MCHVWCHRSLGRGTTGGISDVRETWFNMASVRASGPLVALAPLNKARLRSTERWVSRDCGEEGPRGNDERQRRAEAR